MKIFLLFILYSFISVLLFIPPVHAQEGAHYTCYRTSNPIVADGLLNEPDWSKTEWSDDFVDITGKAELKPPFRTRIKLLWDADNIYLAAQLDEPDVWATIKKRDLVVFHDNDFELFLDPDGNGQNYYEIEVNAFGAIWDLLLTKPYDELGIPVTKWNLDGLKTGIHINGSLNKPASPDTSWIVEMVLPIKELMKGKMAASQPAEGVQWRVNFSRVEWKTEVYGSSYRKITHPLTGKPEPEQNWVWSPMKEVAMHIPKRWGRLEFSTSNITPDPIHFTNEKQKLEFKSWLWMGGHADWDVKKWDSVFSDLKSAGIDGILTQAGPATLLRMIPLAMKYGINVEKWFIAMMNNDSTLIKDHPDWFVVSGEGKSSITDPAYVGYYRFLCPSNHEVRDYLKRRIDEYLKIPGLAGIHLDYIRYPDVILPQALWPTYGIVQDKEYPKYDYCYCPVCRGKFKSIYGKDPLKMEFPDRIKEWRQFRVHQVTAVVSELADYCHARGKRISAAVFPGPSIARQIVRQEWDQWPLDEVMPMLYQSFYYGSHDWIRSKTEEGVQSLNSTVPLYSGLYIPSLNPRDLHDAIQKSIDGGAQGITLFNYESMTPGHWEILKQLAP
ncbi:MAG: sugar-binding protein [Bacteroidota bacterium]